MEKCGKRWKQQKTSETTENVGNVGIGTGRNMVHDSISPLHQQTRIFRIFSHSVA